MPFGADIGATADCAANASGFVFCALFTLLAITNEAMPNSITAAKILIFTSFLYRRFFQDYLY